MSMALEGVRVVDLSTGIAGPMAAMLLADFGADVVKMEAPEGDPCRALPGFAVWNRNKRSIVIDQSLDSGRQRLANFLAGADVCIVSQPRPALAGTQLDPQTVCAAYPGLVFLHTPPHTLVDMPWAGGEESHPLLSAIAGSARRQTSFDGGPIDLVYPIPLYIQGMWAAAAVVAALIERQRSGLGQVVGVGGIHGVMVSCCGQFNVVPTQPQMPTDVGPGGRNPCYSTYQCQDGRWLFLAALTPKFQVNAFAVLGVGNIHADPRIDGVPSRMALPENRAWVRELLADAFCTRPRDEWLERLERGDCPAGALAEREVWLDHPQVVANGLRVEVDDPDRGRVVMPGLPLVLTRTPGVIRAPAPSLGQHGAQAIPWPPRPAPRARPNPDAGSGPPRSAQAEHSSGGPLAGFRVLDLGTIVAGPYAGALLAELGADVVKVEAPSGDPFREPGFVFNRGQRGLAIDLSSADARQAFYALVRCADAVVDNSRLGVRERLKIDYATLAQINPRIVTMSVYGFGEHGPLAHKPGFDPVLQAMSGMMTAQGGDSEPVLFTIPVNDIAAATLCVLGVCLGLFHRGASGEGQRVWTSLAGCAAIMQSGELVRFDGRPPALRGGRDFAGPSALDRFYQVADGWVRLQARHVDSLRAAGLLPKDVSPKTDAELGDALTQTLAALSLEDALGRLNGAGVPAAPALTPAQLATNPASGELGVFATHHLQDGTPYLATQRYARFSRTEEHAVFEAPGLGEHSREVLAEAGLSAADVDQLIAAGLVKQGTPFQVVAIQSYR
ncbi:MAG: CoA transferase [Chloroflexota bacterium]|nr:CoA transferase [Chloroflexota bacterium]